jgi:hypothetical protein
MLVGVLAGHRLLYGLRWALPLRTDNPAQRRECKQTVAPRGLPASGRQPRRAEGRSSRRNISDISRQLANPQAFTSTSHSSACGLQLSGWNAVL